MYVKKSNSYIQGEIMMIIMIMMQERKSVRVAFILYFSGATFGTWAEGSRLTYQRLPQRNMLQINTFWNSYVLTAYYYSCGHINDAIQFETSSLKKVLKILLQDIGRFSLLLFFYNYMMLLLFSFIMKHKPSKCSLPQFVNDDAIKGFGITTMAFKKSFIKGYSIP